MTATVRVLARPLAHVDRVIEAPGAVSRLRRFTLDLAVLEGLADRKSFVGGTLLR